jgi:hypothetical protein
MDPQSRKRNILFRRMLLAFIVSAILVLAVLADKGDGATLAAANRCQPTLSPSSVKYHCLGAYPESFHITGATTSSYRLSWKVICGGRSVAGTPLTKRGIFQETVDLISQDSRKRAAYELMIHSDLCRVDVSAVRVAGTSSLVLDLFINQNHPSPAHN